MRDRSPMPAGRAGRATGAGAPPSNKRAARRVGRTPSLSVELGAERLAFLKAECEREYWCSLTDALRHLVDLRMCARFREGQRRAVARVRSLLRLERRRLAHRNAGADERLAVRRAINLIEGGSDDMLKTGLRLLRAMEARDHAAVQRITCWRAPQPAARRRAS